jgi:hypothetical protein
MWRFRRGSQSSASLASFAIVHGRTHVEDYPSFGNSQLGGGISEKCARSDGVTAVDKSVPVREIPKLFKPRLKD